MVAKIARRMVDDLTTKANSGELNEMLDVVRARINTIILQEAQIDKLDAGGFLNKTYAECLTQSLYGAGDIADALAYVLFELGVTGVVERQGYLLESPLDILKYLIIDVLTSGEYLRQLIKGIIYYNSLGVVLKVSYDLDALCGKMPAEQSVVVECVRSGDVCTLRYIHFKNLLCGYETLEDALTLITDSLCILDGPTGLRFFRDCYFAEKKEIIYSKTRSIPLTYLFYHSEKNSMYYKSVHDTLIHYSADGQTGVPAYCANPHVFNTVKSMNTYSNVISRSTDVQGFLMGVYENGVMRNSTGTAALNQIIN